eukprot:5998551-Amphidinium_carterae.2
MGPFYSSVEPKMLTMFSSLAWMLMGYDTNVDSMTPLTLTSCHCWPPILRHCNCDQLHAANHACHTGESILLQSVCLCSSVC